MRPLVFAYVLVLASCDAITVGPSPSEEAAREEPPPDESELDERPCGELPRGECMRALHCTLGATTIERGPRYVCREARGNCEIGLSQLEEDRDRCADRIGCVWSDGPCYCPCRGAGATAVPDGDESEACRCECSGGPPPGCRPR